MERKIPKDEYVSIIRRIRFGEQLQLIANDYNVTKERIRQIGKVAGILENGNEIRRKQKLTSILREINEESKELFYHSGCDTFDLLEACLEMYKVKRYYYKKNNFQFDVSFAGITWNRFCPFSGKELDYFTERGSLDAPGIYLIDLNKGGYIDGNVHTIARFMKSS